MQAPAPPPPRPRPWLFPVLVAVVLLSVGAVLGYVIGSSGIQQATVRVNVENRLVMDLSVQILVNGKVRTTIEIPSGQTATVDLAVRFAVPDGGLFEVEAIATTGPRDADTIFVSSPGTYVVSLRLG